MTWKKFKEQLKNKVFLIGLTFLNEKGELIEQYQTHGIIVELTDDGIFKIKKDDESIFQMPYDSDTIEVAKEGEYRERSTGIVIKNPDYIMSWEITLKENEDLEEIKKYGFMPAE